MSCSVRMCCLAMLALVVVVCIKYARSLPTKPKFDARTATNHVQHAPLATSLEKDPFTSDDELSGDLEDFDHPDEVENDNEWMVNLNLTRDGTLFEGDIRLNLLQRLHIKVEATMRERRSARTPVEKYAWKENTIYYKIEKSLKKSTRTAIKRGIKHWKKALAGCLRFIRLDKSPEFEKRISKEKFNGLEVDHIEFSGETPGCWSLVGRQGQKQMISIGDKGCANTGTVIHEIGHAVGFWHEQSRRDRDDYIKVLKENIMPEQKDQFRRMRHSETTSMGYAYDFGSIMHYGPKFFTANNKPTIKVKRDYKHLESLLGQREKLSFLDIAQVRAMYKCNVVPSLESRTTCLNRSRKGRDYRGELDYTAHGVMCQPWNEIYPHKSKYDLEDSSDGLGSHNFCRNPQGELDRPWCYTTLTNQEWQYCDLKFCDEVSGQT